MNKLFDLLPLHVKNLAISAAGAVRYNRKYGDDYRNHLSFLLNSNIAEKDEYVSSKLENFLSEISTKTSFYKIPASHALHEMPIIGKQDILGNIDALLLEKPYLSNKSSGTTGQPFHVHYNRSVYQHEYAYWWYHRSYCDVVPGDKVATFAGHKVTYINRTRAPFWAYNYLEKQLIFSSYHMSSENLRHYVNELNRFSPALVHGYTSSLFLLAKYILENNITLQFRPKMIITASESLLDFQSVMIEKAFSQAPFNWYGNTELCGHATQCPNGRIHCQPTHSIVRVVNEDGVDVALGEEGTIVATNYINTCMPLINYNTKDRAIVSTSQHCECGRGGLMLDKIIGRIEDYIYTVDGRAVGRLDHLFKDAKFVSNAQIVQEEPGKITIRIEREAQFNSIIESTILKEAHNRLGKEMRITFDYETPILKNENGKFSFIMQKMPR